MSLLEVMWRMRLERLPSTSNTLGEMYYIRPGRTSMRERNITECNTTGYGTNVFQG